MSQSYPSIVHRQANSSMDYFISMILPLMQLFQIRVVYLQSNERIIVILLDVVQHIQQRQDLMNNKYR